MKDVIEIFKKRFNLKLITQECGYGIVVTGFIPTNHHMFLEFDDIGCEKPEDAYEYTNILAIKGSGVKAKMRLCTWLNSMDYDNLYVEKVELNHKSFIEECELGTYKYVLKRR